MYYGSYLGFSTSTSTQQMGELIKINEMFKQYWEQKQNRESVLVG